MKAHTAQSLGRYLGKRVYVKGDVRTLFSVSMEYGGMVTFDTPLSTEAGSNPPHDISCVYPILKTFKELITPIDNNLKHLPLWVAYDIEISQSADIKTEISDSCILVTAHDRDGVKITRPYVDSNFNFIYYEMDFVDVCQAGRLMDLGFGAIPDPKSPTGYVDLFGYPCVTPEMGDG